jgi:DedD protein
MGLLSSKKPAAPERRSSRNTSEDRLDPAQELRRRARRRLVGAIALVLAAVIVLPMLLDTKRAPLPDDIPISIPGKPPTPVAVTAPESTPAQTPTPPQPQSSPSTAVATVTPPANPTPAQVAPPQVHQTPPPRVVETPPARPEPRPEPVRPEPAPVPTPPRVETPTPPPRPATEASDAARARALLEGRPAVVASASRQEPAKGAFVIQVGAYSTEARAGEVRDRLSGAGLKAFTERVKTGQGDVYRVRVGPYSTREAADSAREKIKSSAGLDSSIVSL